MKLNKALLIVDMQKDFCPGGALSVRQADNIVPAVNKYIRLFAANELPVFLSRDWHPARTSHFKKFGGLWPRHCVQNSAGAQFHPKLVIPKEAIQLYKGMDPRQDSYSVFQAEDANGMGFLNLIKIFGVKKLYIAGLATDYCVRYTAIDAINQGLKVTVLVDAVGGVDLHPGDSEKALDELVKKGARKAQLKTFKL